MPLSKSGPASGFSATTVPCLDRLEVTQELEVPFIKTSSVVVGLNVGMCWYIAVLSVNASAPCTTYLCVIRMKQQVFLWRALMIYTASVSLERFE